MYIAEEAFGVLFEKADFAQVGWWNITSLALSATQGLVDPCCPREIKNYLKKKFVSPPFFPICDSDVSVDFIISPLDWQVQIVNSSIKLQ